MSSMYTSSIVSRNNNKELQVRELDLLYEELLKLLEYGETTTKNYKFLLEELFR